MRFFVTCVRELARLRTILFVMNLSELFLFGSPSEERKIREKIKKNKESIFKRTFGTNARARKVSMLGFITNRVLNAINCTYGPYASCKALMSVEHEDDVKW